MTTSRANLLPVKSILFDTASTLRRNSFACQTKSFVVRRNRMEQSVYIGVRLRKETHDALVKRQLASEVQVSLAALVRHLLDESLGIKRKNGKTRR
jgi:hypothetical protein